MYKLLKAIDRARGHGDRRNVWEKLRDFGIFDGSYVGDIGKCSPLSNSYS